MNTTSPSLIDPAHDIPALGDDVDIILPSELPSAPVLAVAPPLAPTLILRKPGLPKSPLIILELDPHTVIVPDTFNRLKDFADDPKFEELRINIASAGRNSQPILVREIEGQPGRYLLVFGERRLRACQLEGLMVHAMVIGPETPEAADCIERIRENTGRDDLSPYEISQQLKHAAATLKPATQGELAALLGISGSKVSRAKDLAALPDAMIMAFASPREIRIQDIKALKDAWVAQPEAILREAALIQQLAQLLTRAEVLQRYKAAVEVAAKAADETTAAAKGEGGEGFAPCKTATLPATPAEPKPEPLICYGSPVGEWALTAQGTLAIQLRASMSELQRRKLLQLVQGFVQKVLPKPEAAAVVPVGAVAAAEVSADASEETAQATLPFPTQEAA